MGDVRGFRAFPMYVGMKRTRVPVFKDKIAFPMYVGMNV
jgi:hypothetical protein